MADKKIKSPKNVIIYSNGNVACFDKNGEQMGELQKGWLDIWPLIVGRTYTICAPPVDEKDPFRHQESHKVVIKEKKKGYVRYCIKNDPIDISFSRSFDDFIEMINGCK